MFDRQHEKLMMEFHHHQVRLTHTVQSDGVAASSSTCADVWATAAVHSGSGSEIKEKTMKENVNRNSSDGLREEDALTDKLRFKRRGGC